MMEDQKIVPALALSERFRMTDGPVEEVFGRFAVTLERDGDVVITRSGMIGRGGAAIFRAWMPVQVEDALFRARTRRGLEEDRERRQDAIYECKALERAVELLRQGVDHG